VKAAAISETLKLRPDIFAEESTRLTAVPLTSVVCERISYNPLLTARLAGVFGKVVGHLGVVNKGMILPEFDSVAVIEASRARCTTSLVL